MVVAYAKLIYQGAKRQIQAESHPVQFMPGSGNTSEDSEMPSIAICLKLKWPPGESSAWMSSMLMQSKAGSVDWASREVE
jgi:hypothetical protein